MKQPVVLTVRQVADPKTWKRSKGFHDWASYWARPSHDWNEDRHGFRAITHENRPDRRRARCLRSNEPF